MCILLYYWANKNDDDDDDFQRGSRCHFVVHNRPCSVPPTSHVHCYELGGAGTPLSCVPRHFNHCCFHYVMRLKSRLNTEVTSCTTGQKMDSWIKLTILRISKFSNISTSKLGISNWHNRVRITGNLTFAFLCTIHELSYRALSRDFPVLRQTEYCKLTVCHTQQHVINVRLLRLSISSKRTSLCLASYLSWRAVQQSIDIACPRVHGSKPAAVACGGLILGQSDEHRTVT